LLVLILAACAPPRAAAFYLPGSYPQEFVANATVGVKVQSMTSTHTELPFGYYSLPFCKPPGGVRKVAENLGELLMGERVESSAYAFNVMVPVRRQTLCANTLDDRGAGDLSDKVQDGYRVHMSVDGMPITNHALQQTSSDGGGGGGGGGGDGGSDMGVVQTGYPLGFSASGRHYLHNHLVFNVLVHKMDLSAEQLEAFKTFETNRKLRDGITAAAGATGSSGNGGEPESVKPPAGWMIVG
jgi:transmembrane 9 superfamily protein 2/4